MSKSFETNSQSFKDGQIVLYQRPDHLNPRWQCRLHIPGQTGYIVLSAKTRDLFEARKFAELKWDELRLKHISGESLKSKKITSAITAYLDAYEISAPSTKRYEDMKLVLNRYFGKFIEGKTLADITTGTINQYAEWRLTEYERTKPSANYLRKEIGAIKRFHEWCLDRGWCKEIGKWKLPKAENNRRPNFTKTEWKTITSTLQGWVNKGKTKEGGNRYRDRFMLQNYVLILANTGLRTGEARTLRWGDCHKQFRTENGKTVSDMILSVKGKTGKRDVVAAQDTVETCLKRIWDYRKKEIGKEPTKTEPVFTNHQGKAVTSFKKSFSSLLKECGLEQSTDGEKRTLYSLRHTYATFRLDEGMSINDLRLNMGTSVKMIETYYYHALNRRRAAEMKIMKTDRVTPEVQDTLPWEK